MAISDLDTSLIAKQLFTILKERLSKRPTKRVFVLDLSTIRDKQRFQNIVTSLQKRNYIEYEKAFSSVMICVTEKGLLRLTKHDSW